MDYKAWARDEARKRIETDRLGQPIRMIEDWLRREAKHKPYPQGRHPVANRLRASSLDVPNNDAAAALKAEFEKALAKLKAKAKKDERKK